jgi:hypothetical protein
MHYSCQFVTKVLKKRIDEKEEKKAIILVQNPNTGFNWTQGQAPSPVKPMLCLRAFARETKREKISIKMSIYY